MLSTGLYAQTNQTSATRTPPKGQMVSHKPETKEQWLKRYNIMKPKIEDMAANAKAESKNAAFTAEEKKLNNIATAYRLKIDNWDKITLDKRETYNKQLRATSKELNEQYLKVKDMWAKMHPDSRGH